MFYSSASYKIGVLGTQAMCIVTKRCQNIVKHITQGLNQFLRRRKPATRQYPLSSLSTIPRIPKASQNTTRASVTPLRVAQCFELAAGFSSSQLVGIGPQPTVMCYMSPFGARGTWGQEVQTFEYPPNYSKLPSERSASNARIT